MTLQHLLELTGDLEGTNSQQFKDFIVMIESSEMLKPFLLPDVCADWLPSATAVQVGVVRELTNLLQSIKDSIKSLAEEKVLTVIRERRVAIQQSRVLDKTLPSF